MRTRRKKIKVLPHDRKLLVKVYLKYRLPIEQLEARPAELAAFTKEFNRLTGLKHTEHELLHYMRTERKNGDWVKLGRNCQPPPPLPEMTGDEIEALVVIFEENVAILGRGSDDIAYDPEISELLVKSFFEHTGRGLPAHEIIRMLTALRKRGLLTNVSEIPQSDSSGYADDENKTA
jgi:hypothetical protein